jgi:hypothetical protein
MSQSIGAMYILIHNSSLLTTANHEEKRCSVTHNAELPSFESLKDAPKPVQIYFSKFLCKGSKSVRHEPNTAWNAYFVAADVDVKGSEFASKVPPAMHGVYLEEIRTGLGPCCASPWSPMDRVMVGTFVKECYIDMNVSENCDGIIQ